MSALTPVSFTIARDAKPRLSPVRLPGKTSARFWREEELAVLRRYYETGGAQACLLKLPNRHITTIYQRASMLGLRFKGNDGARKPSHGIEPPADIDDVLRRRWPLLVGKGSVGALADELKLPRWWVSKRARKLGLTNPHKKEPPWTAAENALMAKVPLHDPDRAADTFRAHGFRRSPTSIMVRAKRLGLSRRYSETLSATKVAGILGIDNKTSSQLCVSGELKASRRGTLRLPQQGGDAWSIEPADLRRYVLDNLERLDIRKVEKFAFVALLVGAEGER